MEHGAWGMEREQGTRTDQIPPSKGEGGCKRLINKTKDKRQKTKDKSHKKKS
jgi:hypothetical protein